MRYSGELAALGTAACFGSASNLFAAAGRRMGSHVLNRLRITTAWIFLSLALWTVHHAWWPSWAAPSALVALSISGMVGFVFGDAWGFRAIVILGPGRASLLAATAPLFTTALAWPILHQRPGPLAYAGMLLTLGGVGFAKSINSLIRREKSSSRSFCRSSSSGFRLGVRRQKKHPAKKRVAGSRRRTKESVTRAARGPLSSSDRGAAAPGREWCRER